MISIENLSKRYGPVTAVDDISFEVRPGSVVGFLGPNGAGKSTAMRMMTGLTPPTSGRATVLGRPYRELPHPGRHVGVMLDASAQHPGRSGREVLTLAAMHLGLGADDVAAALHRVGLTDTEASRRVRGYSLGMRQRLGLATALIARPEVLILDEPANGLDPQGIHWMRGLLRDFATQGGTVLLSSHLLHEVQAIADEVVMIGRGRIVAQGSTAELLEADGITVRATDEERLAAALEAKGVEVTRLAEGPGTASGLRVRTLAETVGRTALEQQVVLLELGVRGGGLEELFLQLTAADAREGAAA